MVSVIDREHRTDMFRTAVFARNNKCFQHPKLLLYRIKNQYDLLGRFTRSSSSSEENSNPQKLPHLPVPDINATLKKYLKSVKPFVTEDEYQCTKQIVVDFTRSCGTAKNLQEYLVHRAERHTNWLEQWWLDTAYLGYRDPVTIFSSPGQSFPFQCFESEEDRLKYTAKLILAALSYKQLIDTKKLPVDKMGKAELDMKQYEKILGTCRIPASPKDKLEFYPESMHFIVAHKNHFFKVIAMTEEGNPLSEKQIKEQLQFCITHSTQPGSGVGILTSENRDTWSKAHSDLIEDQTNKQSIKEIQQSLFLVCLDQPSSSSTDNRLTVALKQFIHGGSSQLNSGNRWFDKTVQFILSPNGEVGLTYEHSPSEGQPVAAMVDFLHNYIQKDMGCRIPDSVKRYEPVHLEFNINNKVKEAIQQAGININKLTSNLDMTCFKYEKYGKEFVKTQKLSPDSYIQMALQCAFYKIHKEPGAHYESAATRMYIGGRTETIRSCSTESIEFARTLLDTNKTPSEKVEALKNAIGSHKQYTTDAVQGLGVDRHLLGLKLAAGELKMEIPKLFDDIAWKRSSYMRISTSQVATKCDGLMGYAPLVKEGYGCCYNPRENDINFAVSAFVDYPDTSSANFKTNLEWCLNEMQNILLKASKSKL